MADSKKIIFAGPSMNGIDKDEFGGLTFLPPCKQGDIYLATLRKPVAIGVVDGFFEGAPSVWHKEILWALSKGIYVTGTSSMGALRAAELDVFGMQGIGKVYEQYKSGSLTDDDEVALLHGPEEMGHLPLSVPMVNVRATCEKAINFKIIDASTGALIVETAKMIFYKKRDWQTVLERVVQKTKERAQLTDFQTWLADNEVDQKKLDAIELCKHFADNSFAKPFKSDFMFEETEFWFQTRKFWEKQDTLKEPPPSGEAYRLFS